MNLENQVCNLELAKKLKDIGVKQESLFFWVITENANEIVVESNLKFDHSFQFSAFTVAEFGDMLPETIYLMDKPKILIMKKRSKFFIGYRNENYRIYYCEETFCCAVCDKNEANARAKILIYLIENKLMEVPT
jgi:hypothetical protein